MTTNYFIWLGSLWAATTIVGLLGFPISRMLFSASSDRGYAFSKILSLFVVGYLAFLLTTLNIAPLPFPAIISAIGLWGSINVFVLLKMRGKIIFLPRFSCILATEIIFLSVCASVVIIKGFNPEIYQIERFMDFGFIEALRNSTNLPLFDIWLAGETVNYYYFSHFIGFVILTIANIPSVPGFFLLIGFIVGALAAAIARFAIDVAMHIAEEKRALSHAAKFFIGSISVFTALFSGSWYMIPWILRRISFAFGISEMPNFFYPEPTRAIAGTITEMPIFSFLVADIHAHVWGMFSAVLMLAIAHAMWRDNAAKLNASNCYLWAMICALGAAYMLNSWDALTLGALAVSFVLVKYRNSSKIRLAVSAILLAAFSYLVALPWSITNHLPLRGIGLVRERSQILPWLSFWGPIAAIIIAYGFRYAWLAYKEWLRKKSLKERYKNISDKRLEIRLAQKDASRFIGVIFVTGIFFLAAIEIVFAKDILIEGEWYRANTVFKVATQVWIWVAVFAGPVYFWLYRSLVNRAIRVMLAVVLILYIGIGAVYPVIAVSQAFTGGRNFVGIARGLAWWENKYPDDYAAYQYLKKIRDYLPQDEKLKNIVEGEGESYTDASRFSVFLGWPTIVGWPVHEWTWRGSYDIVGKRREDVREIYLGVERERARALLEKYNISYVIIGAVERGLYSNALQESKLRSLGEVVFEQGNTTIIKIK